MRLPANALVFVIVLIAISSITLMTYNQIISNNLMRVTEASIELEALRAHEDAHLYLRFNTDVKIAKPVPSIDEKRNLPFGKTPILTAKPWGLFDIHQVDSEMRGAHLKTQRLAGERSEHSAYVYVSGSKWETLAEPGTEIHTEIYGTFIRAQPPKPGSAAASVILPKNQFPKGSKTLKSADWQLLEHGEIVKFEDFETIGTVRNPDWKLPSLILSGGTIHLQHGDTITGNVIIQAHTSITVDEGAVVSMAVLQAPEIIINKGFKGVAHLNSSRKIRIEPGSSLEYPSTAYMSAKTANDTLQLNINEGAHFEGSISIDDDSDVWLSQIKIAQTAKVIGSISTPGLLDLRGNLWGKCRIGSFAKIEGGSVTNGLLAGGKVFALHEVSNPRIYPLDRDNRSGGPLIIFPISCD